MDRPLASIQGHHSGDTGVVSKNPAKKNAQLLCLLLFRVGYDIFCMEMCFKTSKFKLFGYFWAESRGVRLPDTSASHVGAGAESSSL